MFVEAKLFESKVSKIHRGLAEPVSDDAGLGRMQLNSELNSEYWIEHLWWFIDEISKFLKVRKVNRKKHHKWFIQNVDWRLFYHSDIWRLSGTELQNVFTMNPWFLELLWNRDLHPKLYLNMSRNGKTI